MELQQVPAGADGQGWAPQACTLPTAERPLRLAEFDALFAEAVTEVRPAAPGELQLVLRPAGTLREALEAGCDDLVACAAEERCPLPFADLTVGSGHPVPHNPAPNP
ncbi:hypothetical protein Acsp03_40530 [Actinomadura sp. NBRC 104412]|uniref:hypothetical protein n=1 Tax=Actinomadura sp. NBRC 104412 TaxID=3032203 RepID=UPI0024A1EE69|nr:hypothetical protein [Actinomadura sp. NBRC 104412]GLZ06587.1 hypothetical protein Acsp03_40530 [Actinomadura sp. NBRC 104412]